MPLEIFLYYFINLMGLKADMPTQQCEFENSKVLCYVLMTHKTISNHFWNACVNLQSTT